MQELLEKAKQFNDKLIEHRRHFHQNPEVGLEMPKGQAYVMEQLKAMGYEPKGVGGYGVVALAGGKKPGKTFLIRADMDALPMREETALPFKSENGCMHACGHDCHAAMLLGAAALLKEREDDIQGTVKIFFQTAEETLEGAKDAIEGGLLENPKVDAAMMIHILSGTPLPDGLVGVFGEGPNYASADWYEIHVKGKGGHGAMPHTTISAVNIICAINTAMQEIMSVVVPASAEAVMTVGQIHAGDTSNIIPATAYMTGTIRTFDEEIRSTIKEKLAAVVENVAASRGGEASVTFTNSAPVLVSDKAVAADVLGAMQTELGDKLAVDIRTIMGGAISKVTGSEDFAYIAAKVPSAVCLLSAGTPADGYTYPSHNPHTDFKEDVFYVGAAAYASAAMGWLEKNK